MKCRAILVILLAISCCTQSHAQSFLKNLGQSIKKELKNEVHKKVDQGISNLDEEIVVDDVVEVINIMHRALK